MPNYVCIRDPLSSLDGNWYDLDEIMPDVGPTSFDVENGEPIEFVPTDEFVTREDGAVAQIYIRKNTQTKETP